MEIEMKRVIDGVVYEAVKKNYDTCNGCIGYFSRNHLCKILQNDCKSKIWIKVDTKETQNGDCNTIESNKH